MHRFLLAAFLTFTWLTAAIPVRADPPTFAQTVSACGTPNNTPVVGQPYPITQDTTGKACTSSSFAGAVTVGIIAATTTPAGGTITTHNTFQTALASNAARKGCLVENTSTDVEYVFFGANGSATEATSIALAPAAVASGQGGSISCAVGGLAVATDNLAITSKTADGTATYVVYSQ